MKSLRGGRLLLPVFLLATALQAVAFDLQGHRGARGLAPENTLAAFKAALAIGVSTLELDVGVTRDGHVVIAHDQQLNPNLTRDAQGQWLADTGPAINSLTLVELQRYDVGRLKPDSRYAQGFVEQKAADGESMPTLDALFRLVAQQGHTRVRFNIETKLTPLAPELTLEPEAFAAALLKVIDQYGLRQRVSVQSFDWRTLRAVHQLAPGVATVALSARQNFLDNIGSGHWTAGVRLEDHAASVPRMVKALGAPVWSPFHGDLTPASLAEAQALGLKVVPWTVNDPALMDRLIGWGVDGLISDYPDRLRAAVARRGLPLPPPWPAR